MIEAAKVVVKSSLKAWGCLFGCDKIERLTTQTQGLHDIRYADCPSKREYVFRFDGRGYVE